MAIVGAGCSGTLTALHLLAREAPAGTRILLFERRGVFGPGRAYTTTHPAHRLNVPAGAMSAFAERPSHFLDWARARAPSARDCDFLPRGLYGAYLAALLDAAEGEGAARGVVLERRIEGVRAIRRPHAQALQLETATGGRECADVAVLALGNLPTAPRADFPASCYVADPWRPGALEGPPDAPVLLLGTGLTMLDVVLALVAAGLRAPIHAVSRRGLVSRAHRPAHAQPPPRAPLASLALWPRTARGLLRGLRAELALAAAAGSDWRDVIAGLRADTPALWRQLPPPERRRFLEHLRPWWDVHRHRSAPETACAVEALRREGRLEVLAGRVAGCRERAGGGVDVTLRLRGGRGERTLSVARVVDCTGPCSDLAQTGDPLVRQLLADGIARPDPLRLGFDGDGDGHLVDGDGRREPRLVTLGPLRRGERWECTAVPEIRVEAQRLAARVGAFLRSARNGRRSRRRASS